MNWKIVLKNSILPAIISILILVVMAFFPTRLNPYFDNPIVLQISDCHQDPLTLGCWDKMSYSFSGYPLTYIYFIVRGDYFGPPIDINFVNLFADFFVYFFGVMIIIKTFQYLNKLIDDIFN